MDCRGGEAKYPGDVLKIDRSFVSSILHDDGSEEIVRAIIGLAHGLNLGSIAEGGRRSSFGSCGRSAAERAQGFLFSKPRPADEIEPLIAAWDPSLATGSVALHG